MAGPTIPVDIVNRALDNCGLEEIGDIEDGSRAARVATRYYWPTVRQLLSGAHWNFARKQENLTLIGDASGQANANRNVPSPWSYMYEWPGDAVHARYVPRTQQTAVPNPPIFPGQNANASTFGWNSPAPFIVASADITNTLSSNWYLLEGHDPAQTRVILTNQLSAQLIYTGLMQYPDSWDPLFEEAVVASLAMRFAIALISDRKEGRVIRADNMGIAKAAIDMARVRDGDEGWTVVDHTPDWIRARTGYGGWSGIGVLGYPWCNIGWLEDAGGAY